MRMEKNDFVFSFFRNPSNGGERKLHALNIQLTDDKKKL